MPSSSQSLQDIFEQALLAQAAYVDINGIAFDDSESLADILKGKLGPYAATYLAARFGVLDQTPEGMGYSGTLFARRASTDGSNLNPLDPPQYTFALRGSEDLIDWLFSDADIVFEGNTFIQIGSMKAHFDALRQTYGFAADSLNVTGHSLGGHLATALAADPGRQDYVRHVFTYNGAGVFRGDSLFGSESLPAALSSALAEAMGFVSPTLADPKVSNFGGTAGPDLIYGTHTLLGSKNDIFTEFSLDPRRIHAAENLVMGAASYYLLSQIDGTKTWADFRLILEASSNQAGSSYEAFATCLRKLFPDAAGGAANETDGDQTIFGLIAAFEDPDGSGSVKAARLPGELVSLVGMSAADVVTLALTTSGPDAGKAQAVRFALVEGLPFAVVGNLKDGDPAPYNDASGKYDLANLSDEYLQARADYLFALFNRNYLDAESSQAVFSSDTYQDLATDTILGNTDDPDSADGRQIIFGQEGSESINGGACGELSFFSPICRYPAESLLERPHPLAS